ncbi:MAG: glycosyltransferase family 4 protein [Candidatus Didemnitutus sp.]|nr:glycosyltransferase family 4 protein [Candidatus Didemnitutus sp.]
MNETLSPSAPPRVLFINQVCGPLFRELVEDVAPQLGPVELLTGTELEVAPARRAHLRVRPAPAYDRRATWRRISSWLTFGAVAFFRSLGGDRRKLLFLVSNPPFLGLIGWLVSILTGRRYVVLIYDLYPGMLENLGKVRRGGLVAGLWHAMNRVVWNRAACVFTIGDELADNIRPHLALGAGAPRLVVIPNWADSTFVRPVPKAENCFARRIGETDKLTVLYSGNLGNSHDLNPLLSIAGQVREQWTEVSFLIIGGGVRFAELEQRIRVEALTNVKLMPLQPEADLPYTLTTGEVAVVTFERGAEGFMVPSKTYYYLAAGCALLVVASAPNSVSKLVEEHHCGLVVAPDDRAGLAAALDRFRTDPEFLASCRRNARAVQEKYFGRGNSQLYVRELASLLAGGTGN